MLGFQGSQEASNALSIALAAWRKPPRSSVSPRCRRSIEYFCVSRDARQPDRQLGICDCRCSRAKPQQGRACNGSIREETSTSTYLSLRLLGYHAFPATRAGVEGPSCHVTSLRRQWKSRDVRPTGGEACGGVHGKISGYPSEAVVACWLPLLGPYRTEKIAANRRRCVCCIRAATWFRLLNGRRTFCQCKGTPTRWCYFQPWIIYVLRQPGSRDRRG